MTHAHDDIRVGTLCLPFIGNGCQTYASCQADLELIRKQRGS